jgi:hypothetical protein
MDAYTKLSITISKPNLAVKDKVIAICQMVKSKIPQAHRVSLWVFSNDYKEIISLGCFDENNHFTSGAILTRTDFPEYFDYILKHQVLIANQARNNMATSCFNSAYFEPNNIFSLLDYIYHHDFKPTGIICCEAVDQKIEWQDNCINVLRRIANLSSIFFAKSIESMNKENLLP